MNPVKKNTIIFLRTELCTCTYLFYIYIYIYVCVCVCVCICIYEILIESWTSHYLLLYYCFSKLYSRSGSYEIQKSIYWSSGTSDSLVMQTDVSKAVFPRSLSLSPPLPNLVPWISQGISPSNKSTNFCSS